MTSGRGDEAYLAAGGPARHVPVLRDEVVAALAPREGGLYLDATFGAGGYSKALLAKPNTQVLALDRDPAAIAGGAWLQAEAQGRLCLVKERFGRLDQAARRSVVLISTALCSTSACRPCKSATPARGFPSRPTARSICAHGRRGDDCRGSCQYRRETTLAKFFTISARSVRPAVSPMPSSRTAPRRLSPRRRCSLQ